MEGRNLDITIVSAEDLKKVNLIGKMHTYAVAWVDPHLRQQTVVDKVGDAKPHWNQKLSFPVPEHFFQQPNSNLTVEIFSKGAISDDTFVGAAIIPLSDLAQKTNNDKVSTYQVKRKSGKVKGSLQLVTHVGEKTTISGGTASMPYAATPVAAYAHGKQYGEAAPYGYPPSAAAPYGYPPSAQYPQAYGGYEGQGYSQYPQAYGGYGGQGYSQGSYYPQAGAPPQYYAAQPPPQYYAAQPPKRQGMGGMGMGLGAGLLAGAVGGLIVGDIVDDAFDGGCDDGGFDF